jgi:pimeloyl-ACP methyl ester carboxylesterase
MRYRMTTMVLVLAMVAAAQTADAQLAFPPADVVRMIAHPERYAAAELDEHSIQLPNGHTYYVHETYTVRSWMRWPHRGNWFMSGPVTDTRFTNITIPGYNVGERFAARGFFAFAVDYSGFGRSWKPADGRTAAIYTDADDLAQVSLLMQFARLIPRLTLVSESIGGGTAVRMASAPGAEYRYDRLVISTVLNEGMSPVGLAALGPGSQFCDGLVAPANATNNGYMFLPPAFFGIVDPMADNAVNAYLPAVAAGFYPTGMFNGSCGTWAPYYDPSLARVPGLFVPGRWDFVPSAQDLVNIPARYGTNSGTPARMVSRIIEDGGHIPRIEDKWHGPCGGDFATDPYNCGAPHPTDNPQGLTPREEYWQRVFAFVDP